METDEGTWGTVVVRLGSLTSDERPNVRCNLAMLAGALAPTDRRAFDELVGIALTSINRLLREEAPAEEDVLETVVDEREALPEACKARFDATVGAKLVESEQLAGFDPAIEGVLRLPQRALHLLPPQVIASAILSDARRLAPELTRTDDALGRDRRRGRLIRISQLFESSLPGVREDIQAFLSKGIDALSSAERRAVVLALLLSAPRLLQRTQAGRHPVSIATLCSGARRVRPKMLTLIGLSTARSLWPAACLTGLMAVKIALWGSLGDDGSGSVLGAGLELALIAFAAAWLTSVGFVPSVGRFLSGFYFNASNMGAAILGAVFAVTVSLLFIDTLYKEVPAEAPGWALIEMMAVLIPTVFLAAPAVQYFHGRYTDYRWLLMIACVAGPGIVIATAIAGYAALTHDQALQPFWPMTIVCTSSVAFTVVALESAAWPAPEAVVARPQAPQWRWILLSAGIVPEILLAVGLVRAGMDRAAVHPQALTVLAPGAAPARQEVRVRPDRHVELRLHGDTFPVRVGIDPGSASYPILAGSGDAPPKPGVGAAATGGQRQFVFHTGTATLCLNTCGPTWPTMDRWLAVLWGGRSPPVPLSIWVAPRLKGSPSNTGEGLVPSSNGTIDAVAFAAGGMRVLTLSESSRVTLKVSGKGNFGSVPSLAGFSPDSSGSTWKTFFPVTDPTTVPVDDRPGDHLDFDLPAGDYRICVYFGGADLTGCPVSDGTATVLFEPGTAMLSGKVVPLRYVLGGSDAAVGGDGSTELAFAAPMNRPVWLTMPITNSVSLSFKPTHGAEVLRLDVDKDSGEAVGLSLSGSRERLQATGTLQAGKYWLCINSVSRCGVGEPGPQVLIQASFVRPFTQITQHVGP